MTKKNHISRKNHESALENIGRKLKLLEHWLTHGLPTSEKGSESCPISLRQFNAWTKKDDEIDGARFAANAAATLRQHPEITQQALALMDSIRQRETIRAKRRTISEIGQVRQALALERARRASVERQYVKSRIELEKAEKGQRDLAVRLQNLEAEAKSEIASREHDIAVLRREIKDLISNLAKLAPLVRKR